MAEPPAEIQDFCDKIRSSNIEELRRDSRFIDLGANERLISHPLLSSNRELAEKLQIQFSTYQHAYWECTARCILNCPQKGYHEHGTQANGVLRVKGFPEIHIVPKLLVPALPELLDEVMGVITGTTYPWEENPQQVTFACHFRNNILSTFGEIFDIDQGDTCVERFMSTVERSSGLRRPRLENKVVDRLIGGDTESRVENAPFVHMTFGCDAILVVGNQTLAQRQNNDEDKDAGDGKWTDLVDLGSDSEDNTGTIESSSELDEASKEDGSQPTNHGLETNLAAILLRAGEILVFDDDNSNTWYGIAKVTEESSQLAAQWPHLRKDMRCSDPGQLRGQLAGKTIEVEFH